MFMKREVIIDKVFGLSKKDIFLMFGIVKVFHTNESKLKIMGIEMLSLQHSSMCRQKIKDDT